MENQSVSGLTFSDDERVGISDAGSEWLRAENIALAGRMILEDIESGVCALVSEARMGTGMLVGDLIIPARRMAQLVEVVRMGKILLAGFTD